MSAQPFAGLKVMDLAWVVAGPLIGRTLAEYGATVVRVESSRRVETARLMGPFPGGRSDVQQSALYENCNANKLGLSLDLTVAEARAVALDLAALSASRSSPSCPARWRFGLGYETLRQRNPGLVMLSTSLMGERPVLAVRRGYGNVGRARRLPDDRR
ncbi:MAG: CoA transferase [Steroidobacteraceae bacterium]